MSFSVNPKDGPNINALPTGKPSARDRTIAKLTQASNEQQQRQQAPVQSATQVAPEELSAIMAPSVAQTDIISDPAEAAAPEVTKPAADPIKPHYAQLARQEAAFRAKAQKLEASYRAKEQAFAEREAALAAKEQEYTSNYIPKSRLKQDALTVLAEEGVDYNSLTQQILNPIQQDPRVTAELNELRKQLKATQEAQEKANKAQEQQQKQAYDNAVTQIRHDATRLVQNDPEFETIKATGSVRDVVDLITKTYAEDKILMTVQEAAREVEEFLVDRLSGYSRIGKVQARLKPATPSQAAAPSTQQQSQAPKTVTMKTLTNSVNASTPTSARERAIAAFKGTLK